jgi:membrane protein required for colicin V production
MPYVQQFIERPGAVFLVSFGGLFLLSALFFTLIGHWLHNVLEVNLLGWLNRITGGILGVVRGALVTVLLYMFLAAVLPSAYPLFEGSVAVPYLNQGAEIIRQFIRDVSVRNDLKPKPAQKANAQEKKPSKTQAPAETKKVESTTIPDQVEPITPPVPEQQNSQGPVKR